MCYALHYLLDNIFIRFGSKLYRQILGIPMGTNCAPLFADFFFLVKRETSCCLLLTIIKLFNSILKISRCLLSIDNPYFEQMVGQI